MIKLFSTLCLLVVSLPCLAQNIELPTAYVRNEYYGNNEIPENTSGTPFLNETFMPGTVKTDEGDYNTLLRYHAYRDYFESKNAEGKINTVLRRPFISITIGDDLYQVRDYNKESSIRKGYFKILNEGKNELLLKQGVVLKEAVVATTSYQRDEPASLRPYEKYYLKIGDQPAVEIKLRKKDILELLKDKSARDYIKDNKLKLRKEAEVIDLLNHVNNS